MVMDFVQNLIVICRVKIKLLAFIFKNVCVNLKKRWIYKNGQGIFKL